MGHFTRSFLWVLPALMLATPSHAQFRFGQPNDERKVQATLPQSNAVLWRLLATSRITENASTGMYAATHTPAVRALSGTRMVISGFMLPLDTAPRSRHFLISRYTPVCFFHPPGAPNEVIEVYSDTAIPITDRLISVIGRFTLINDPEKGLFFRISNAESRVSR